MWVIGDWRTDVFQFLSYKSAGKFGPSSSALRQKSRVVVSKEGHRAAFIYNWILSVLQ